MLTHTTFPQAILHIDGDAFFASCEVAKDPSLRGKPVVTGRERGIVSSMSYEAKALGVSRAMKLHMVKKMFPSVIILPSDYETYSLYSRRMYAIVRRYTLAVEEYSIDECFADLTGMRRPNKMSYEEMAIRLKDDLDGELGISFSIGLSVNKVMAKVGSKWKKPSGLTIIPGRDIHLYLAQLPLIKIWGIGSQTAAYLNKLGLKTALDFAGQSPAWVAEKLSKPFQEIYRELNGDFVYPLVLGDKHDYASISKTKTFTPPSRDRAFIFAQLAKNVENACIKLRRHDLHARQFAFFLKTQEFRHYGLEIKLSQPISTPSEILGIIRERLSEVYRPNVLYRATGIVLMELTHGDVQTIDLFGKYKEITRVNKIYEAIDALSVKYGKHTIFLGSSLKAVTEKAHAGSRGQVSERRNHLFKGETARKRLGIPFMGKVV